MITPPAPMLSNLIGRGVRKMDKRQYPLIGAADAEPILMSYSWKLDTGADSTPVEMDVPNNRLIIKSSFSYKYRFNQVTIKRHNLDIGNLKDTGSFSTPPKQAGTGPNMHEVKVVGLPNIFTAADYISGSSEWVLDDCNIVADVERDYFVTKNTMSAETHWLRKPLTVSKEVVQLNTILEEEDF